MSEPPSIIEVPARKGHALRLAQGDEIDVVNIHGGQVVDTWAFPLDAADEYMSMEHSRIAHYRLAFRPGDTLFTDRWRPILAFVADTSPGIHDTLCPACSEMSYRTFYGCDYRHDNCTDNLRAAFARLDRPLGRVPTPWNLFMETVVEDNSVLKDYPSRTAAGQYVRLRAEMDCLFAVSACPQDIVPINGEGVPPRGIELRLRRARRELHQGRQGTEE